MEVRKSTDFTQVVGASHRAIQDVIAKSKDRKSEQTVALLSAVCQKRELNILEALDFNDRSVLSAHIAETKGHQKDDQQ